MTRNMERTAVFIFGIVFVVVMLVLAVRIPNPTASQYDTFKIVLALAAAGVAAFIPGFVEVTVPGWLRAGGALAVFAIVFFKTPANLVVSGPLALSMGSKTSNAGAVVLDFGRVAADQIMTARVDADNLSPRSRDVSVQSSTAELSGVWSSGDQIATIPPSERRDFSVKMPSTATSGSVISLNEGAVKLREIKIEFEVVPKTIATEKPSGPKASGRGGDFSESYPLCLGPAPKQYTLIADSVRFWLTGDRSCGNWSHCDAVSKDDSDVCYSFSLQGHSENGSSANSEGHLRAEYRLKPFEPVLR